MMMYDQIQFGCKRISSLEDTVEQTFFFYYVSPHCHLDLDISISLSLHDTSSDDDTHHTKFGYQRLSGSEVYITQTHRETYTGKDGHINKHNDSNIYWPPHQKKTKLGKELLITHTYIYICRERDIYVSSACVWDPPHSSHSLN